LNKLSQGNKDNYESPLHHIESQASSPFQSTEAASITSRYRYEQSSDDVKGGGSKKSNSL